MATTKTLNGADPTALAPVTNLAEYTLAASEPYRVHLTIQGTSTLLFHRWNCEAVEAKAKAAKGSAASGSASRSCTGTPPEAKTAAAR